MNLGDCSALRPNPPYSISVENAVSMLQSETVRYQNLSINFNLETGENFGAKPDPNRSKYSLDEIAPPEYEDNPDVAPP